MDIANARLPATPAVMHWRLSGSLNALLACGIATRIDERTIELVISEKEADEGGMATISMNVPVRVADGVVDELFSAWIAIPPAVEDGTILEPSTLLPGMV